MQARILTTDRPVAGEVDRVTGLVGRHDFYRAVDAVAATNTPWAVLLVDLDRFQDVNERHGYLAGDDVLRTVAERLRRSVGAADVVARIGGDEFALVLQWPDAPDIAGLALAVIGSVEQPIQLADGTVTVGCTLGIGTAAGGDAAVEVLAAADRDRAVRKSHRRDAHVTLQH